MPDVKIQDFVVDAYHTYWNYMNRRGKNGIEPREQLHETVAKAVIASIQVGVTVNKEVKTVEVSSELAKYAAHGESLSETVKGIASLHKSHPAVRILRGIGNFGSLSGDTGAAPRYTHLTGTPLLARIAADLKYIPKIKGETGLDEPEYISSPLPFALIGGSSPIGAGISTYIPERDPREIVDYIEKMYKSGWTGRYKMPNATSVTGCEVYYEPANGYTYHIAKIVEEGKGRNKTWNIVALPPQTSVVTALTRLIDKYPNASFQDASGKGQPVKIISSIPIPREDFASLRLQYARKERVMIFDEDQGVMREGSINDVAKEWFEDRSKVVEARLRDQVAILERENLKFDLIKHFADSKMQDWDESDVVADYIKLAESMERTEDDGRDDAKMVLSMPVRAFLPQNIAANELTLQKNNTKISNLNKDLSDVGSIVISEARETIDEQEAYFSN